MTQSYLGIIIYRQAKNWLIVKIDRFLLDQARQFSLGVPCSFCYYFHNCTKINDLFSIGYISLCSHWHIRAQWYHVHSFPKNVSPSLNTLARTKSTIHAYVSIDYIYMLYFILSIWWTVGGKRKKSLLVYIVFSLLQANMKIMSLRNRKYMTGIVK